MQRGRPTLLIAAGLAVAAAIAAVLALTAGDEGDQLDAAAAYLPADTPAAVAIETDLGEGEWDSFARTGAEPLAHRLGIPLSGFAGLSGLEGPASLALLQRGIDYDDEVRPLLGGELVYGVAGNDGAGPSFAQSFSYVAALEVGDADTAGRLLHDLGFRRAGEYRGASLFTDGDSGGSDEDANLALDGDVLVVADSDLDSGTLLRASIDRAHGDSHLTAERFQDALPDGEGDALVRAYLNARQLLAQDPELGRSRGMAWFEALRTVGASVSFEGRRVELELVATTNPERIDAGDLPVGPGRDPKLLLKPFGGSRFVRKVEEVRRDLGTDFEWKAEAIEGPGSAGSLYASDLRRARGQISRLLGFPLGAIRSLRASVENDLESLQLRATALYD